MSALISITGLTKKYAKDTVLDDVSLTVSAGQIFGLLGPNGAGKTTCLQALLGLTSYQGDIDVLGYNPAKDRVKMLSEVAYIADVAILPKWMKVQQTIAYMAAVHPKFNRTKALAFLAKTNIGLSTKIKNLSKGMITQVHLALILAVDAKVLVLDEPTLGLDLLTRRQFYDHLLEDFYRSDKCILITTHQIEEIEHILTDIAFIQEGKLVMTASLKQLQQRFSCLSVTAEQKQAALELKPLYTHSQMGLTSMIFDSADHSQLSELGTVSTPTLAEIFIASVSGSPPTASIDAIHNPGGSL